jgi:hypothetical protein
MDLESYFIVYDYINNQNKYINFIELYNQIKMYH